MNPEDRAEICRWRRDRDRYGFTSIPRDLDVEPLVSGEFRCVFRARHRMQAMVWLACRRAKEAKEAKPLRFFNSQVSTSTLASTLEVAIAANINLDEDGES